MFENKLILNITLSTLCFTTKNLTYVFKPKSLHKLFIEQRFPEGSN